MQGKHALSQYIKQTIVNFSNINKHINYLGVQGFNNPEMEAAILKM